MKKIFLIAFLSVFIIHGCLDRSLTKDDAESTLLVLLDEDRAIGVDGFDSDGGIDLDYEIGVET